MAGSFVFVQYTGSDAGSVLAALLSEEAPRAEEHELVTHTHRVAGFAIPEPDEDEDEVEEGDDDEADAKR